MGGGSTNLQFSASPNQGGVSISKQLRKAGVLMGTYYHNPNQLVRLLGKMNESEIENWWEIRHSINKQLCDDLNGELGAL